MILNQCFPHPIDFYFGKLSCIEIGTLIFVIIDHQMHFKKASFPINHYLFEPYKCKNIS